MFLIFQFLLLSL